MPIKIPISQHVQEIREPLAPAILQMRILQTSIAQYQYPLTKIWDDDNNRDGIRAENITVKLLANGIDTGKQLMLNSENEWSGMFFDVAEYNNGQKIIYTIEEISIPGYDTVITGDSSEGFEITNSHEPEKINISGCKTWEDANNQDGKRPDSITIRIYANGSELKDSAIKVTADDNWEWTFKDLPKYENGIEIIYTITEDALSGYSAKIDEYTVINSYTPGKTSVSVTKCWDDG